MSYESVLRREHNTELLPCPFCGSDDIELSDTGHSTADEQNFTYSFLVICNNCNVSTDDFDSKEQALSFWNTRAIPSKD